MLDAPFSEEEVFAALSDLNGDKAPGLDGFTMVLWQFSWSFLKEEVMGFFKDFHDQGKFVKSINASFLVLIPKKGGVEDLKDFRPISLVGSLYKLLAKVLANRLKKVMGQIMSKSLLPCITPVCFLASLPLLIYYVLIYQKKKSC